MIKAIIVDDEPKGAKNLEILLHKYCPQVQILGLYETIIQAKVAVNELKPSLLFLDIEMPFGNGFELIEQTNGDSYEVIFTTAYNNYAVNAFKVAAVDYLLKPIDIDELINAVSKAEKRLEITNIELVVNHINNNKSKRIPLKTNDGVLFFNSNEIICFEADSNYTYVYLDCKKKITVSETLKRFEKLIEDIAFLRVHSSYIINLSFIEKYTKGDGGTLIMKDGQTIPVSRAYKQILLKELGLG